MLKDTFRAQSEEIVVDMFAGAGGASCGLEMADIHVHAAINHDPVAVSLHARNHPETEHHVQDVYTLSPQWVTRGRRVGLLWMSPDCTHHSKAKGGAPTRNVRRRELAMVLVDRWIPELGDRAPRVVILENVEEFAEWGPLDNKGRIIEAAKGERFRTFVRKLRSCGYRVDWRELRACDYGAPTIRKRLFMIARRDNQAIVWPEPTHGAPDSPEVLAGTRKPWRTAAECIGWSLPCPSIFASSEEIMARYGIRAVRPLAENTLKRIAKGVVRYVLSNPTPFIVTNTSGHSPTDIAEPLATQTTGNHHALVRPFLAHLNHTADYYAYFRGQDMDTPMSTITTSFGASLIQPFLAKHFGGVVGQPVDVPAGTVTLITIPCAPRTWSKCVAPTLATPRAPPCIPFPPRGRTMRCVPHTSSGTTSATASGHPAETPCPRSCREAEERRPSFPHSLPNTTGRASDAPRTPPCIPSRRKIASGSSRSALRERHTSSPT